MDQYDAANRLVQMTDSTGAKYGPFTYDAGGNLTTFPDRSGNNVAFGYDGSGNLTSITDPNGDKYTLGYDASKRVTSIAEPSGTTEAAETGNSNAAPRSTTYTLDPAQVWRAEEHKQAHSSPIIAVGWLGW